jgi:hypothetical protein
MRQALLLTANNKNGGVTMAIIYTPGNAQASQVLAGAKFSAGSVYNGTGTMRDMSGQEMSTTSAYMEEGYLSMSVQGLGGGAYAAVDDSTQLTFASPVQIRASNIIQGIEMLGLDGTATSDATATAADIKTGVIAYSQGQKLVGTASVAPAFSVTSINSTQFASLTNTSTSITFRVSIPLAFTPTNVLSVAVTMESLSGTKVTWNEAGGGAVRFAMCAIRPTVNGSFIFPMNIMYGANASSLVRGVARSVTISGNTVLVDVEINTSGSSTLTLVGGSVPFVASVVAY